MALVSTPTRASSSRRGGGWEISEFFFDRQKILDMVEAKTAKALTRIGALVRKIAQRSMRKRKKVSSPGEPPSAHEGGLRRNIYFAYDPASTTVVIGPTPYNMRSYVFEGGGKGRNFIKGAVPSILERGGMVGVRELFNVVKETWDRIPWGYNIKDRYVPVWLATPAEKAASVAVKTIRRGKRALNFYRVPRDKVRQRIRYAKIAPRPYMAPALMKAMETYPSAWAIDGGGRFSGDSV
jgi:hypothetical protein